MSDVFPTLLHKMLESQSAVDAASYIPAVSQNDDLKTLVNRSQRVVVTLGSRASLTLRRTRPIAAAVI
jgi:hypothetical protein